MAGLEQQRAFAFRRLNLMQAVAKAVGPAEDEPTAIAYALAALRLCQPDAGPTRTAKRMSPRR
jgi:hypothetical protein